MRTLKKKTFAQETLFFVLPHTHQHPIHTRNTIHRPSPHISTPYTQQDTFQKKKKSQNLITLLF
jgi:hypothetical protein